jgi:hypothetical protein
MKNAVGDLAKWDQGSLNIETALIPIFFLILSIY